MSQVARGAYENRAYPPPPPSTCRNRFPASGETPVTEVPLYQVCELVLGRPTGACHNTDAVLEYEEN